MSKSSLKERAKAVRNAAIEAVTQETDEQQHVAGSSVPEKKHDQERS